MDVWKMNFSFWDGPISGAMVSFKEASYVYLSLYIYGEDLPEMPSGLTGLTSSNHDFRTETPNLRVKSYAAGEAKNT